MGIEIRKKGKYAKTEEFMKEIKKIHKEVKATLTKLQREMKKYVDRNRKEAVKYKVRDKILLSTKNLM